MTKRGAKNDIIELLKLNNQNEVKKWLISNGKSGKPVCPIMFLNKENVEKEWEERKKSSNE